MVFERLIIETDEGGWVRFVRPDGFGGAHADDSIEVPPGFALEHVVAAAEATGWVVHQDAQWSIAEHVGCDQLCRAVEELLAYFDRPDEPGPELLRIKHEIDSYLNADDSSRIPLCAYAWLEVALRDDVTEAARSVSSLWQAERLTIDLGRLRDRRIDELRLRYLEGDAAAAVAPPEMRQAAARVMAPSARTRDIVAARNRSAG